MKTSSEIVFHGVTESNKQTEAYFMKNNIDTVERIFKNATKQHGKKKALGTRKVLGEEDEIQENGQIFKKVLIVVVHYLFQFYFVMFSRLNVI